MSVYENKIIVIVIAFIEFFGKGRGYYLEICNSTFESHCIWSMFELPNEIAKDYVNMIFRIAQYEKKISAMLRGDLFINAACVTSLYYTLCMFKGIFKWDKKWE